MEIVLAWIVVGGLWCFGVVPLFCPILSYWDSVKAGNAFCLALAALGAIVWVSFWAMNTIALYYFG